MDLFGLGWLEILVILVIAFIVFGPEKLPEISRSVGKTINSFKKAASDITQEVTRDLEEEKKAVHQLASDAQKEMKDIDSPSARQEPTPGQSTRIPAATDHQATPKT